MGRAAHLVKGLLQPIMYILGPLIAKDLVYRTRCFGDKRRIKVAPSAVIFNTFFNVISGDVIIEEFVFFGQNVCIYTGTHDMTKFDRERQVAVPASGRDVIIKRGAWIASSSVLIGPCVIGEHAVVAAGAVVTGDVPAYAIVGGVPARFIRDVRDIKTTSTPSVSGTEVI